MLSILSECTLLVEENIHMQEALGNENRNADVFESVAVRQKRPVFVITRELAGHCFTVGRRILDEKLGTVLATFSVGNPFSSEENIRSVLGLVAPQAKVRVFIPQEISHHTFEALGYSEQDSLRLARAKGQNIAHKLERALYASPFQAQRQEIVRIDWNHEVDSAAAYQCEYPYFDTLYNDSESFRVAVRSTTESVVKKGAEREGKLLSDAELQQRINLGVPFLIKELAFIIASPEILRTDSVVYLYHRRWPIFERLLNGEFDGNIRETVGFAVVDDGTGKA